MRRFAGLIGLAAAATGFLLAGSPGAALLDRGPGLVYDDDLDITWMRDANPAVDLGASPGGLMTRAEASQFLDRINARIRPWGVDGWRLPVTPAAPDNGCSQPANEGTGCTESELGHLYYVELGNSAGEGGLADRGPFRDIEVESGYWSNWDPASPGVPPQSMTFRFRTGQQVRSDDSERHRVWLVHDGDVGPRPRLPDLAGISAKLDGVDVPSRRARVTDTAGNLGSARAPASKTRFFLSRHPDYFTRDVPLAGIRLVPELAPGGSSSGSTTVRWALPVRPGRYAVLICADAPAEVVESDEYNNCAASPTFEVPAR